MFTFEITGYKKLYISLGIIAVLYVVLAFYLGFMLKFDFSLTDSDYYWQDSLNWKTPFNPYHVPGYALILAMVRIIMPFTVSPLLLMMGINVLALLISMTLVYKIILMNTREEQTAAAGAYFFALWPLVGLVYTVDPIADIPVLLLFLAGLYGLQRGKLFQGAVFFSLALIVHKAIWIFVVVVFSLNIFFKGKKMRWKYLAAMLIILVPIGSLWLAGSFYYKSLFWIIAYDLKLEVFSHDGLPLLDGLVGTILRGDLRGFVKGGVILCIAFLSLFFLFTSYRYKMDGFPEYLGISGAVFLLIIIINQYEIWASVRYSRLLVLPLAGILSYKKISLKSKRKNGLLTGILIILFALSQFVYGWYMVKVHYVNIDPSSKIKIDSHKAPYEKVHF